jgi:4-hydroxy-3-methylbut-2-enyl diphosphate reductase
MRITVARTAGFCWGVRRTVQKVFAVAGGPAPVGTLGPVIHNPQTVERLVGLGVRRFDAVKDVPAGTRLVIRTHGAVAPERALADARGLEVIDGTCPYVKYPQVMAERLSREGYHVVIVGDAGHAEVRGVASRCVGPCTVVRAGDPLPDLPGVRKVALISQTTNDRRHFQAAVAEAAGRFREVRAIDTICFDTGERQAEVRELARAVEVLVVVGGRESANTRHLAEIGASILGEARVHHVERAAELSPAWFAGVREVGISAGASTPDDVIEEVAAGIATLAGEPAERCYHRPSFVPTHPNH